MASAHSHQDRYVVILSPLASRKVVPLCAGHPSPTAPPARLRVPNPTAAVFSPFYQVLSPGPALASSRHRQPQIPSSPIYAIIVLP